MINDIIKDSEYRMKKCIEVFKVQINKIRTNRISVGILDNIIIKYYGIPTSLRKLANITIENMQTLKINIFDKSIKSSIEKEIIALDLGLSVNSTGNDIFISLLPLTEERRKKMTKILRNEAEHSRISIRNVRRDANEKIKCLLQNKNINEDENIYFQERIQKLTDLTIGKIDIILTNKKKELIQF